MQYDQKLSATFTGTVTRIGFYQDTLPKLIITVKKHGLLALPFRNGERVPVTLAIDGKRFTAGVRTTDRSATVMISPDLNDAEQNPVRLSDLLYSSGWDNKSSRIDLKIEDGVISFI
jgi:hypothetical protein